MNMLLVACRSLGGAVGDGARQAASGFVCGTVCTSLLFEPYTRRADKIHTKRASLVTEIEQFPLYMDAGASTFMPPRTEQLIARAVQCTR
jgi:hypothetical protein